MWGREGEEGGDGGGDGDKGMAFIGVLWIIVEYWKRAFGFVY